MAGNSININGKVDLKVNVQAESARQQIANLQKSLQQVANIELNVKGDSLTEEIQNASQAALQLQSHLNNAINVKTNNLDFSKFSASLNASIKNGGKSLQEYSDSLIALGPQGKTAFMNLANAIASSEVPLKKTNKLLDTTWDNLKKTIGWQFSSSMIHGFIGSIQQAIGYAQDLDKSLTDIRIVTGASKDQMADFAKEANSAAKKLSTTTTEYTKASLIYYQQGLSDSEVKARTETTIKMANATGTSAQKVSDQMTAIWNNYDNGTKSLTHYADVMTALGAATASSTDEIAQGLQKFASISDTVGLSYEYAASALATVTATSRESADIVGNSFKTLFSRIQGLQLGKTLEDGTDLNKYSSALASVGINIKDASGQLKDMDIILDEMGASWTSLARDEKMALAQTVAGVRQYTQLMTLMENWDYFKENLNVANNSQGTLDTQASIYAESWMAASDRVRASWEGVWDSLINSDSFITVLDGISGLIGMLDTMVESFGGAGGTIALFGGLLGKAFTPQITKTIEDTAYNLKMLTPKGRQSVIDQRNNLIESMRGSIADAGTFGMGDTETRVARENLARAAEQSANRAEWRSRLNEQELMEADFLEARIAKNRNAKMQLAADIDAAEEANTNLVEDRLNGGRTKFGKWLQGSSADDAQAIIDNADKEMAALEAREKAIKKGKETFKDGESYSDLHKQRDEWGRKKASAINLKNRAETREQTMNNAAMMGSNFLNIFGFDFWNGTSIDQDTKKMKMNYKSLQGKMKEAAAKAGFKDLNPINEMIDEVFNGISETDSVDKNRGKIRALGEKIARSAAEEILAGITDETTRQQAQEYMDNIFKAETGREALTSYDTADDRDSARLKEMGEKKPSKIETAVDIADNAMMIMAAAQAANALGESLKLAMNNSGSFADVLAGGVSMLSTGLFSGLQMFKTLSTFMDPITAGIISIASVALPALISGITGFNEASQELENERNEKVLEETDALKERLDTNKQLVKSMNDAISSYESTMKSYQKGESSYEDTIAARQDLVNNIQSSSEDYSPEVISKILAGDTAGATKQIYEDRSREISNNLSQFQKGQESAGNLMGDAAEQGVLGDWFWGGEINAGLIDRYHGDTASGKAIDSFINYLHTISTDYAHLTEGISGINISDVAEDPASFIQFYDDAKKGLQYLQEQDLIDNDYYRSLESFINKNAANVEQYKKYQSDMTNLQAEKAAIDKEFYNIDALAKQDGITALKKYDQMRKDLIEANSKIEGFEEALDQYLNQVSQLKDTSQGNLPAVYKALQSAQEATKRSTSETLKDGLNMDTMIDLYNSLGNDMFNINFEAMTTDALSQLQKAIEMVQANGEELTMENIIKAVVVLEDGGVNSELMSILQAAQALADANAIKVKIEIVSDFDPEKDLFDPKKRQEFLDAYNDIMGNKEGDADYIDSNDLSLMTSDEIEEMQFRGTQKGRSQEIANAQSRVTEWSGIKEDLEVQQDAYKEAVNAARQDYFGNAQGGTDQQKALGFVYADQISEYAKLQNFKEQGIATDSDLTRMQGIQNELAGTGIIDDSGNLSQFYAENIKGINDIAEARDNLSGVNEQLATATSELSNAEMDVSNSHLAQQELLQKEAEYYNVDMDAVRKYAKELADSKKIVKEADETTEQFNNRLLRAALDYQENTEGLRELQQAYNDFQKAEKKGNQVASKNAWEQMRKSIAKITKLPLNKVTDEFMKQVKEAGTLEKALRGDVKAVKELENAGRKMTFMDKTTDIGAAVDDVFGGATDKIQGFADLVNTTMAGMDIGQTFASANAGAAAQIEAVFSSMVAKAVAGGASMEQAVASATEKMAEQGIEVVPKPVPINATETGSYNEAQYLVFEGAFGRLVVPLPDYTDTDQQQQQGELMGYEFRKLGEGGASSPGGGGGGGGGGGQPKEPKKVANKRKSSTVSRYKKTDFKLDLGEKSTKSAERKKDYLYGESKIAQMEKINKLAQKEANITADRIKESRKYLVEDRENLIKYMQKYGFEAEFDADGFLSNYEETWTKIYNEIAALYEDNLLTENEEKIEEDLNIKLEELEGALEDYENSLSELADDIEKYEESLFEIYDNKVDALEHKVEFKIELSEDDLEYLDFWIESLGDNIYNAIEAIEAMGAKANALFDGLETYQQGIMDIMSLSEDPLQVWATGGIEGILTQAQVDALRDNRDGLADYMQQLIDLREEIKDKVIDTFDLWTERIEANISSIEHYSSVIEYFKNMVDTIGKDPFGLSDQFVNQLEQSAINQSLDYIDSQKTYYESLVEQQAKAQEELDAARARGDESSAEHWEEVVRTTTEAMEEAQDSLLSGLDNTLTMIAEQFETAMQRAVDAFNDAIYAYGGLEGLSNDYDMIRENADLMAADYEKIYELSKLTRDINKVLDDTNIIAGKKKMNGLLKEINELQADGVELSKYDLEYLRAKYELRLAEIELENAQNSKDTVRLSKDSEGNWSYVYTQNADAVEKAEQKYEDALYEMQTLSQEYLEEMSGMMIETSQAMMEEISALRIQDFTSYEAYQTEIKRIQDKYAQSLKFQEDELNKSIQNSSDLYEQDWQAYNQATGYKISLAENWVDSFREATLGDIMDIDTFMSGFSDTFLSLTDEMSAQLADAAIQYFGNVDTAMKTYGTSIEGFGRTTTTTIDNISQKSKTAKDDLKTMASEMSDAFKEIADYVSGWQEEFSGQIDTMLEEIKTLIQSINEAIRKSAELTNGQSGAEGLIGSAEAIELLNATGLFGTWSKDGSVGVKVDGKATNFVDYNAALIEEIDDAVARYANAKTGTEEREKLGEELKELFKRYWQFRDIVNRVYDPTNLTTNMDAPTFTSMDTGGYTGEWGDSGKFAMLHEKELVLNANDTKNFLDALNISRDVINSMIEMNARASSLALGDLFPSLVQDFGQTLEQTVTITAEFPDATDHNEIEEAFNNLLNTASQYANRNRD